jgi:acetyl esterase/lipase
METFPLPGIVAPRRMLDIFRPDRPNGRAILWVHGGGWSAGGREGWHECARFFCARGYLCASTGYRLAPAAIFPAQIEDVRLALDFLRGRADELKIRRRAIAAAGSSAGGHLVALLGTIGPGDMLGATPELNGRDTSPDAVICYCPVTDLCDAADPSGELGPVKRAFLGADPAADPARARQASPLHRVRPGLPPFLFLHGDADDIVPLAHSERMTAALAAAGVRAECRVLPGVGHGFGYGVATAAQRLALAEIEKFLETVLAGERNDGQRG